MPTETRESRLKLISFIKRELIVEAGYSELTENLPADECFRLVRRMPNSPTQTLSLISADPEKPRFYLRITRLMEETGYSESYEIYDLGTFGKSFFQPSFWSFGRITSSDIRIITIRIGDAINRAESFFQRGDAGLRNCERKSIVVMG